MKKFILLIKHFFISVLSEFSGLNHNIKTYVIYGILYDVMFNLYKPYSAKFAERLGGSELHMTLLTALPGFFAVLALVPGSVYLTRFRDKKRITAIFFACARCFLILLALTPLLDDGYQAMIFVIILSAMNFPDAISQASLQSFLGDLFMPRQRADAIAVRSKFGNIAITAALTFACLVLNFAGNTNDSKILVYQVFYILAFLFGVAEIVVFMRLRPKKKNIPPAAPFDFKSRFPAIMKDKKFMTYCLVALAFHFAYFMGFPLSNIKLINDLKANELWVGISAITGVITIVMSSNFWGRTIQRRGTGFVLMLSAIGLGVNGVLMAISPNPQVFAILALFGGWFTCGVNIGVLNGLLESTPDKDRVVYVGVFQTFVNLTLCIAPFFALFVNVNYGINVSLYATAVLRVLCGIAIWFVYGNSKNSAQTE